MTLLVRGAHPLADNLRAAGLIAVAMALYALSDAFIKKLASTMPVGEIMGLRGIIMIALLWMLLNRQGHHFVRGWLHPWNVTRGVVEVACAGLYFLGLAHLPLGS